MSESRLAMGVVLCASCLVMLGCGGAIADTEETSSNRSGSFKDPFAGSGADLKAGSAEAPETEVDPEDLQIPGSEYGSKKGKGGGSGQAKANCPKGKKGKKCRESAKKSSGPIPFSDAIKAQMEGIPWGMHYTAVIARFENRINKEYDEELKNTVDALEEHKIRDKLNKEIKKLKKSYVEFNGQRTGYEGAVLEKEFTHNNGESVLVWDSEKFVEYLFFFNGRFWKRLRTFRAEVLKIDNFETYIATLVQNFGEGKEMKNAKGELEKVMWQNDDTYMTAMDQSSFFGVFSLSFTAKVSEDNLDKLRANKGRDDGSVKSSVSSMTQEVTSGDLSDENSSVVDSYTGEDHGKTAGIDKDDSVLSDRNDTKVQQPSKGGKNAGKKGAAKGDEGAGASGGGGGGGGDDLF